MRDGLLSKKETGLDDLENSQIIQHSEDANIRNSLSGKHFLERKPEVWLGNLLLVPAGLRGEEYLTTQKAF